MSNETVLCQRLGTTATHLDEWLRAHERNKVAEFLEGRFEERYFNPIQSMKCDQKSGFLIMAICCMTLEALESFRRGWPSTERHTKAAFKGFLTREVRFAAFGPYATAFYKHVRCGILHQGETTGGWKIRRRGPLFDDALMAVNATRFHNELRNVLLDYVNELRDSEYRSPVWKKARKKLSNVVANCEKQESSQ